MSFKLKVLVVEDSLFFRRRISEVLHAAPDIEVVGTAVNGEDGVHQAKRLKPDLITMDVQMPVLDGISAVRQIMQESPTRILMLSALTRSGAVETLKALEAGALDFLPKEQEAFSASDPSNQSSELLEKVRSVSMSPLSQLKAQAAGVVHRPLRTISATHSNAGLDEQAKLLAIGASTGGPMALQNLLAQLPRRFPLPVLVAVHMPASFTGPFAERLNEVCALTVREAKNLEPLQPGQVLICPGGQQMTLEENRAGASVRISPPQPNDIYHPSVDRLFASCARVMGAQTLALMLTGMGSDGLEGSRQLRDAGAQIWSQDEASCVVYGMPRAVEQAGITDRVLSLREMAAELVRLS